MARDDSDRGSENQGERQDASGSRSQSGSETGVGRNQPGAAVVSTNDPAVAHPPEGPDDWQQEPEATVSVGTSEVRASMPVARNGLPPMVVLTPHAPRQDETKQKKPTKKEDQSSDEGNEKSDDSAEESQDKERKSKQKTDDGANKQDSGEKNKSHSKKNGKSKEGENKSSSDDEKKHDQEDAKSHGDRDRKHDHAKQDEGPSTTKMLLMAGAVSLLCGLLGALGYQYFFGGESQSDDDKHASSSDKKSGGSQQGKSGSSKQDKGSDEGQTGSASNERQTIPGFTTTEDAESLRKQIGRLSQQIYALHVRMDQLTRSEEQTPPNLHTLQIKVGEMAQTIHELAKLPSQIRQTSSRVASLEQKLKVLSDRVSERDDESPGNPAAVYGAGTTEVPASVANPLPSGVAGAAPRGHALGATQRALEQRSRP